MGQNNINMLGINLTYKCNLNCFMCGQKHMVMIDPKQEVDFDALCKFILEAKKYNLKYGVYLWGGEPTFYSKFNELLQFLSENKIYVTINTNGTTLEKYAEQIVKTRVHRIIVSIDGIGETHDKIRGVKGTYDKVVKGIERINELKKRVPIISTNTVITSENYNNIFEIIDGIDKLNVNKMECQLPIYFSDECGLEYEQRMLNEFNMEGKYWKGFLGEYSNINVAQLCKELEKVKEKFGRKFSLSPDLNKDQIAKYFENPETIYPDKVCSLPFNQIHIEPNGNAVVCPDFPDYVFGNIYKESLEQIWNSEQIIKLRKSIQEKQLSLCSRCCQFYEF